MSAEDQKSNASLAGQGFSRRKVLSLGGGLAVASLVAPMNYAVAAGQFDGKQVVFASWGGAYQDAQKECYCVPFEKKTGAKVLQDGPMDEAKFRTMVQSGNPVWDVVDVTHEFLYNGIKNNLFEKMDLSKIDVSRISPRYRTDYGIGDIVWSYNIGYSTKQFTEDNHPKSWADIFDTKKFSGSRTMPGNTPAPAMEVALMADGVTPGELYKVLATPEGVKRAFDKLSSIKQQIIFWETNSQSQQLFADGEVSCGVILNGRAYDAAQKGVPIAIDWNQNIQSIDYLVIPRGSKNVDIAHGLINEMTVAENQAKLANKIAYSPTNSDAFEGIDAKVAPWLATNPENAAKGFVIGADFWQDHLEKLTEEWEGWKLS